MSDEKDSKTKIIVKLVLDFLLELFDGILRPLLAASVLLILLFVVFMGLADHFNLKQPGRFFSFDNSCCVVSFLLAAFVGFVAVVDAIVFSVVVFRQTIQKQVKTKRSRALAPLQDASWYSVLQGVMALGMLLALACHIAGRFAGWNQNVGAVFFLSIAGVSFLIQLAQICDDNNQWVVGGLLAVPIAIATADCVTSFRIEASNNQYDAGYWFHVVGLVIGASALIFRYFWMSLRKDDGKLWRLRLPLEVAVIIAVAVGTLYFGYSYDKPVLWDLGIHTPKRV